MSDNARRAAAYINLVLTEGTSSLWPQDINTLKAALGILNGMTR